MSLARTQTHSTRKAKHYIYFHTHAHTHTHTRTCTQSHINDAERHEMPANINAHTNITSRQIYRQIPSASSYLDSYFHFLAVVSRNVVIIKSKTNPTQNMK